MATNSSVCFRRRSKLNRWKSHEEYSEAKTYKSKPELRKSNVKADLFLFISGNNYCQSHRLRSSPSSVKSKLGRTGESELAERETGERRKEEGLHSLL